MKDIIPYTFEETQKLGDIFFKMGIPSFGPGTGKELLRIVEGIDLVIAKNDSKLSNDMKEVLLGYRARIMDVCTTSAHHQERVINHFEKLLKKK